VIRSLLVTATFAVAAPQPSMAQRRTIHPEIHTFDSVISRRVHASYLLYLPPGYQQPNTTWPLLLFLHGAGERGSDLTVLRRQVLPRLAERGDLPFILVAPQTPNGEMWSTDALVGLLDHLEGELRVDRSRMYLTGLSMGGFGAWELATARPERFAALVVISGGGNPVEVCRLRDTPVWIVHGRKDDIIPVNWSEEMAKRLEQCHGRVRLTIYEDAGHDAWTRTYSDPAFTSWLLAQRKER
jgi:predicted peptidase